MAVEPNLSEHANGRVYGAMVVDLCEQLADGRLRQGDRLPTENELRDTFGISINSVRKGIQLFIEAGVVSRRRGSGMYVARVPQLPPRPVRRDHLALVYDLRLNRYHPYYTELRRGLGETAVRLGWRTVLLPAAAPDEWLQGDADFINFDETAVLDQLRQRRELAGAIVPAPRAAALRHGCRPELPLVTTSSNDAIPYAGYDWDEEMLTAMRAVLRRGARHLLVVGSPARRTPLTLLQQAAYLELGDANGAALEVLPPLIVGPVNFSRISHERYAQCVEAFRSTLLDGVVIGSDFEAQGVLDAAAELPAARRGSLSMAALVSRESRLPSALPYTAVVADGYRAGEAAIELLHELTTTHGTAIGRYLLRGLVKEIRP